MADGTRGGLGSAGVALSPLTVCPDLSILRPKTILHTGDTKVPHKESCKKRLRQAEKANSANRAVRSAIRTSIKAIRAAKSQDEALKEMPNLFSMLDKAAAKGRAGFNPNRVANYKAKAAKVINGLAAAKA